MTGASVILACVGVVLVTAAAFVGSLPLGLLTMGAVALTAAYCLRYLEVRR